MNTVLIAGGAGAVAAAGYLAYRHDQRKDAALRQERLNEQLRIHPQSVLLPLRETYVTRNGNLDRGIASAAKAAGAAETKEAKWSAQIWRGNDPKLGFIVIVAVLTFLWGGLFLLQRSTDITVMQALGSVAPQLFGNVIAIVFVILGIAMSGIAGVHHLLPSWMEPKRVLTRVVIISGLTLVAIAGINQVADLAQYRSIDKFGAQVNADKAVAAQLKAKESSPAIQVQITSAEDTLAQDQQRLDKAKSMDKALTMAVLPAELLLSAFPIIAIELLVVSGFGRIGKRWRKIEQNAKDERTALPQQFRQQAATMLAQANPNMTVAEINTMLAQLGGPQVPTIIGGNTPRRSALQLVPASKNDTPPAAPTTAQDGPITAPQDDDPPRTGGLGDVRIFGDNDAAPRVQEPAHDATAPQPPNDPDDDPPTWSVA
jgi:hypothetical protein